MEHGCGCRKCCNEVGEADLWARVLGKEVETDRTWGQDGEQALLSPTAPAPVHAYTSQFLSSCSRGASRESLLGEAFRGSIGGITACRFNMGSTVLSPPVPFEGLVFG